MIKKQFVLVSDHIKAQLLKILNGYNKPKRMKSDFLESIYLGQVAVEDREKAMELITYTTHRLLELHKDCGCKAMMDIIGD